MASRPIHPCLSTSRAGAGSVGHGKPGKLQAGCSFCSSLLGSALSLPEGVTGPLPFNATGFLPWKPAELQAHLAASAAAQNLSVDYHKLNCPRMQYIIGERMYSELRADSTLAAGLIRLYFNDCFPNVSCADILALAAREAVKFVGGTINFDVPLDRLDSLAPATYRDVSAIPSASTQQASVILAAFASRGFNHPAELVLLSGAHSIGRAHCTSFKDRADRQSDDFSWKLFMDCRRDMFRLQELDHITPDRLDSQYYTNLMAREGVLTSDMTLFNDPTMASWVEFYHYNPDNFPIMMGRLYTVRRGSRQGEIRRYGCFKPNSAGPGVGS